MRLMKTTAVAVALAVGGLTAPVSSFLSATDAAAEQRVVRKHVEVRPNGNRIVTKRIVTRRPGVRVVDGRYFYGGRYYDQNEALAAGLIGFAAGAILGGVLAQPTVVAPYRQPAVVPY